MASKSIYILILVVVLMGKGRVDATIGVNWGRESAQRIIPSMVVDLMMQNGVKEARIYTSREDLLKAFAGSGIGLTLSVNDLGALKTYDQCKAWVKTRLPYFNVSTVRRIYVGGNPVASALVDRSVFTRSMEVLQNLQKALDDAGWGDQVKATFTHNIHELKKNITKPSEAEFRDEIKQDMAAFLRFARDNDAPFAIDMVPNLQVETYHLDWDFSFVEDTGIVVKDVNGAVYTNIFEFVHDSFVWALTKLKVPNLKIVVSQVGWPTDGYGRGNTTVAERFFKGLLPYVASNKGTPLRPGAPIDTFVHSLTDENRLPDQFMRHWGIYQSNGKPKFKIDLTGQDRDIYPTSAKGIMRMPERWCVFNGNRTDFPKVMDQFKLACNMSDCSRLRPDGSCSHLSFAQNVSFAFNMAFQFTFQDEKWCNFGGLGYITVENPSTPNCMFPVEVVEGVQENYAATKARTDLQIAQAHHYTPNCAISLLLVFFLRVLLWNSYS